MNMYIAATGQNEGKTTICIGLLGVLRRRLGNVGYFKPVGQRFSLVNGAKVDKDAILMKSVYGFKEELKDMNPITVPPGFTEQYILHGNREELRERVTECYGRIAQDKKAVVIEGTGHAGVGSVLDLANAEVSKLLHAPVILVTRGGVGRPIDEIMLNKGSFDAQGVRLLGAIINKVYPDRRERINGLLQKAFEKKKVEVLGVIPYEDTLSNPSLAAIAEHIGGELVCGEKELNRTVSRVLVGAMPPREAMNRLGPGTLLITPGNREDNILAAIGASLARPTRDYSVSGIVITGGCRPHKTVMQLLESVPIPAISVKEDTYATACRINYLIAKIRPNDANKISAAEELIEEYVDVDRILSLIGTGSGSMFHVN